MPERSLWTFCDPTRPQLGFCLDISQAKEIRNRHNRALAERDIRLVAQRERGNKLEARLEQSDADKARQRTMTVGISAGVGVGSLLIGILLGSLFFNH